MQPTVLTTQSTHFSKKAIAEAGRPLISQQRPVRFQDVDAAGTIYFPRIFEYFSDTYLALLIEAGLDVPTMLARRERAAPLVHAEADYEAPLHFGDSVDVHVVLAHLGTSSTRYGYRVNKTDGTLAAVGQTHHVWIDSHTFKPCPMPAALRSHLLGRPGVTTET